MFHQPVNSDDFRLGLTDASELAQFHAANFQSPIVRKASTPNAGDETNLLHHMARHSGLGAGWIPDALAQLNQIEQEAIDEGYPPITDKAKEEARHLLFATGGSPLEPSVYPSMDGEIGIYFKSPVRSSALLILVNNQGGVGCFSSIRGKSRRKRYEDSSNLPDKFLRAQLRALSGTSVWQIVVK